MKMKNRRQIIGGKRSNREEGERREIGGEREIRIFEGGGGAVRVFCHLC